mmetsp:Transcript_145085/g.464971  ORF Transcript_145085/g.464971 Transcript_145085/m.464971 type:complete len:227 (+) Transcript_145085:822-1502(+)
MVDQPGAEDGRQNVRAGHQSRGQGQQGRLDASICEQTVGVRHQAVDAAELLEGRQADAQEDGGPEERVAHRLNDPDARNRLCRIHCLFEIPQLEFQGGLPLVVEIHLLWHLHAIRPIEHRARHLHLAARHQQRGRVHGADEEEEQCLNHGHDQREAQKTAPIPHIQACKGLPRAGGRRRLRDAEGDGGEDTQGDEDAVHRTVRAAALPRRDLRDKHGRGDGRDAEA